ncbi:MAG: glycosyltransferase [Comamonadaceae bacterium]|nr:MAG: glycosyltransferase [Comamonadaceae bacterium]
MEQGLIPHAARPVPEARSVLVLAPHPDDEVFGCGGALALHVAAGARVHVVVVTGGQLAGDAQQRRAESMAAARVLGYDEPAFWNLPDGGVQYGEALVQRIAGALAQAGASVLYAPSLWENHPDHRAVALAAIEAARRREGCELMCYEVGAALRPNLLVDITPVLERKREAVRCFTSQLALQRYDRHIEALNVFRSYTLGGAVDAAEGFEHYDAALLASGRMPFLDSEYRRQQAAGLMALPQELPLVSVLIRSMDRPEIGKALDSLAAQTWPRLEVVVIDAKGSGHRPIAPWCGRHPMRLVGTGAPLHRSAAANFGMREASGSLLLLLDDDDWIDPDHIHKLATALQERTDAVAAVTGTRGVDTEGRPTHEWNAPAAHRLMLANQMPIMSVLFRKPATEGGPRFDETLDIFEDWDFWLQLAQTGRFASVPGISATYLIRQIGGSGVHEPESTRAARATLRAKWRGRWPDAWFDALQLDVDAQAGALARTQAQLDAAAKTAERLEAEVLRTDGERHRFVVIAQERYELIGRMQEAARVQAAELAEARQAVHVGNVDLAETTRALQATHALQLTTQHERNLAHAELAARSTELAARTAELEARTSQLEAVEAELEVQRAFARERVEELDRVRAEADREMQAILQSRSWRLTAPLRSLLVGSRKLRGPNRE